MCTAASAAAAVGAVVYRPSDPESAIKYLVPNYLAGSLIGKKGATIKDVSLQMSMTRKWRVLSDQLQRLDKKKIRFFLTKISV